MRQKLTNKYAGTQLTAQKTPAVHSKAMKKSQGPAVTATRLLESYFSSEKLVMTGPRDPWGPSWNRLASRDAVGYGKGIRDSMYTDTRHRIQEGPTWR